MNQITAITGILILATLCEALVEHLVAPIVDGRGAEDPQREQWRVLGLRYISAGLGMILCVLYQADLLALLGLATPWPFVGWLLTGLVIGRGANWVHDFAGRWLVQE